MPILDRKDFEIWLEMSEVGNIVENKALPSRLTLAVNMLNEFVVDINPMNLAPQMRMRREAVLRKVWGVKRD